MDVSQRQKGIYAFAAYRLDHVRRTVMRDGEPLHLTPRLFDLTTYLIAHHDRVVSHVELAQSIWGPRSVADTNLPVAIFVLRKLLQRDDASRSLISTVPGQGFQLAVPVVVEAAPHGVVGGNPRAPVGPSAPGTGTVRPKRTWARGRIVGLARSFICTIASIIAWRSVLPPRGDRAAQAAFTPPAHSIAVMAFSNDSGKSIPATI